MSASHIVEPNPLTAAAAAWKKVVIFGASGHAKVVLDILLKLGAYLIVGLLDEIKPPGFTFEGQTVLGTSAELPRLTEEHAGLGVVVAVGDNFVRARIVNSILSLCPSTDFIPVIHPAAQIAASALVDRGTVIMPGAVVNAGSHVGEFCIINTRSSLDHDSTMHAYSSLAPGVTTGGGVTIGAYSNIGLGATVFPGVTIGEHTLIGAASLVFRSVPDRVIAYGTPARIIRPREPGDRYLRELRDQRS